ncbi:LOW QUALITY PROTEIN: GDSL esterase/lipase At2g04570-like [Dioscorea cayenensis subsp. rotundata]|uniref:LOW QUALITY PROTEIN: GDSL esterase/lipase At2g04570-like n=1 Tax=Dioscorea cayennensis subsp. rotundata TaxID=55577 RepID=A0AB40BXS1_DIOCR|nr:LOW QUALITY PROTEIN: GDSL esterase/lipase At2g04570-like [Dioscorea cayenensis subsp. rotundata]
MSLKVCLQHMLLVHLLFCFTQITTASVSAIIVFGDSTVDAGNNNQLQTMAKSNFEPYGRDFIGGKPTGRFCNGRLATDFISEAFGLPPIIPAYLDPTFTIQNFSTGVSFASAASGYDNVTADVLSVIPLWKQMEYFKDYRRKLIAFQGLIKARKTLKNALYVMSLGTNDFLENYYTTPRRYRQQPVDQYENFLVGIAQKFIIKLYRLGARKIDLTGLPPMGCLPLERATNFFSASNCNEDYDIVANQFNIKLQNLVTKLNRQLLGLELVYADVYTPFAKVVNDPISYGFDNGERGCCATGLFEMGYICNTRNPFTCIDANKYVFWDAFHPTERMYSIIADHLMKTSLGAFL